MPKIDINQILQKITEIINKIPPFINNLPEIIKNSPKDEQIAYGAIGTGIILVIIGIFVRVVAAIV